MPKNLIKLAVRFFKAKSGELHIKYGLSQQVSAESSSSNDKQYAEADAKHSKFIQEMLSEQLVKMMSSSLVAIVTTEMAAALSKPSAGVTYSMYYDEGSDSLAALGDTDVSSLLGDG